MVAMDIVWIACVDQLPKKREKPYQVAVICCKNYGDNTAYSDEGIRNIAQDWVVRQWPKNFKYWMELPKLPKENHGL